MLLLLCRNQDSICNVDKATALISRYILYMKKHFNLHIYNNISPIKLFFHGSGFDGNQQQNSLRNNEMLISVFCMKNNYNFDSCRWMLRGLWKKRIHTSSSSTQSVPPTELIIYIHVDELYVKYSSAKESTTKNF